MFRLVHISDIHIGPENTANQNTASSALEEIIAFVARLDPKPDVIAISGDLVDSPTSNYFLSATTFVNRLEEHLCEGGRVIACMGNHDVRHYGNFGLGTIKGRQKPYRSRFEKYLAPYISKEKDVVVTSVDSTSAGSFARGGFSHDELLRVLTSAGVGDKPAPSFRIALTHHHVLPVLQTEGGGELSRVEEMLLVAHNPATFIDVLMRSKYTLLLHGHKHVRSSWIVRRDVGASDSLMASAELAIVACGSSTGGRAPSIAQSQYKGLGVLDYVSASYATYSFYRRNNVGFERLADRVIVPLPRNALERVPHCSRLIRKLVITPHGDVYFSERALGLHCRSEEKSALLCRVHTDKGQHTLSEATLTSVPENRATVRQAVEDRGGIKTVQYTATFSPALAKTPVSTLLQSKMLNALATCKEESILSKDSTAGEERELSEQLGITVVVPSEVLELLVDITPLACADESASTLKVDRRTEVNDSFSFDQTKAIKSASVFALTPSGVPDTDERARLAMNLLVNDCGEISLTVPAPKYGYTYGIQWLLSGHKRFGERGSVPDRQRQKLLDIGVRTRVHDDLPKLRDKLEKLLPKVWTGSRNSSPPTGYVHLAISTLDSTTGMIVDIATTDSRYRDGFASRIGEGVVGRAFKTHADIACTPSGATSREYYSPGPQGSQEHKALISIPDLRRFEERDYPLAVLTIASYYVDNKLYRFAKALQSVDRAETNELAGEAVRFLEGVRTCLQDFLHSVVDVSGEIDLNQSTVPKEI